MKIRLKQAWKTWPVGHVFTEMPANQARLLISRGIGAEVQEEASSGGLLSRMMPSPVDRMMRPAKRGR